MIQKKTQTINSLADLENFENCHLSLQVSLNGMQYCVYDKDLVDVVLLNDISFTERPQTPTQLLHLIEEVYKTEPQLSEKYDSVSVSHQNNLASFVPDALYEETHVSDYLKYSVKVLDNDHVVTDSIVEGDSKNVYIPLQGINEFFFHKYDKVSFTHSSSILVSSLLRYYKLHAGKHFFVNVCKNNVDIVFINNNHLELFNSFLFYTKEDFLYYVLFVMEQLRLNPDDQKVTLLGAIEKNDELYEILYTYVRYVHFLEVENYSISEEFYRQNPHVKKHNYFVLLNQF